MSLLCHRGRRKHLASFSVWPKTAIYSARLLITISVAIMCLCLLCMPGTVQAMSYATVKDLSGQEITRVIKYIYPRSNATQMGWLLPGQSVQVIEYGPQYCMIYDENTFTYVKTDALMFQGETPATYDLPGSGIQEMIQKWPPSYAYVKQVPGLHQIPLYLAPDESAAILGSYYAGVSVEVLEISDDWAQVLLPVNTAMGEADDVGQLGHRSQTGYMMQSCLSFYEDPIHVLSDVPIVQVVATGEEKHIDFAAQPDDSAEVIGQFIPGAQVELLGTVDAQSTDGTWGHVVHAGISGFIKAENLRPNGQMAILSEYWVRLPKKGYVVQKAPIDSDFESFTDMYLFPTLDCKEKKEILGRHGKPLEWIADLDGWTQTQTMEETEILRGFIPSYDLVYFPMYANASIALNQGTYIVGEALVSDNVLPVGEVLPAGFYTFYMLEGASGTIAIEGLDASFQKHYEAQGNTSYTMYLVAGAQVTVPSGGVLLPMSADRIVNEDAGYTFSGNGRFLIGEQIPGNPYCGLYYIRLKPGESSGYFILSNLLWEDKTWDNDEETDMRSFPERIDVQEGDEYIIFPDGGYFIELYNVELECSFGNG